MEKAECITSGNRGVLKQNPMVNPLVVENICSFLSLPLLLKTRLVNSLFSYYSTAARSFRTETEIRLERVEEVTKFSKLMETRLQDRFPFSRYYIDISTFTRKDVLGVLLEFGPIITELRLNEFCLSFNPKRDKRRARTLILELLSVCPNVQTLEISTKLEILLNGEDKSKILGNFSGLHSLSVQADVLEKRPITKMNLGVFIASQSPQLKELFIPLTNCDYQQSHKGLANPMLTKELIAVTQSDPIFRLSATSLNSRTLHTFQELFDLRLKFVTLDIDILGYRGNDGPLTFFHPWMTQQSAHLEKLKLEVWLPVPIPTSHFQLPELKELKTLEIAFLFTSHAIPEVYQLTRPFDIQGLPNLSSLILHKYDGFGSFASLCLPTVTHLELKNVNSKGGCFGFSAPWPKVLPNLSSLKFQLDADQDAGSIIKLSYILSQFIRIQDLELDITSKNASSDFWAVFTGDKPLVTDEYFEFCNEKYVKNYKIANEEKEEYVRIPSLANLKRLRRLVIRPGSRLNMQAVVFMTLEGLLKPLQHLEIHGADRELKDVVLYRNLMSYCHQAIIIKFDKQIKDTEGESNLSVHMANVTARLISYYSRAANPVLRQWIQGNEIMVYERDEEQINN